MTPEQLEAYPELKRFVEAAPKRFEKGTTKCDGDDCWTQLTPKTFNVFITPQHTGLILCMRCLHIYRLKFNKQFSN